MSEVAKGARCNSEVASWYARLSNRDLFLSSLVLREIRKGAEQVRPRDPAKAKAIEDWLAEVRVAFEGRILPVDAEVADRWGRMEARRIAPVIDALLAATAEANGLVLATRNEGDMRDLGATIFNPFKPGKR